MSMFDLRSRLTAVNALVPQTITTSAINTGNEDLFGFNAALIVVVPGTIDGLSGGSPTAGTIAIKVEHADDDGSGSPDTFANVTAVDITGVTSVSSGVIATLSESVTTILQYSYVGDKRWLKVTLTPSGLGSGGPITVAIVKGHARHAS